MIVATLIPDDALLYDVAQQAIAQHLHLVTNGQRFALTPVVPAGWQKVHVGIKEAQQCAA